MPPMQKSAYYGVISNRDYIKLAGERRPFYEFLDRQPDGWLTSLTYKTDTVPPASAPEIWDCGAWSYRLDPLPRYSVAECVAKYREHAAHCAFVIAPDHMLITGVDLDARRRINRENAKAFLAQCPPWLVPMVVVHGDSLEERIMVATDYDQLGYRHFAIGGLAARASQPKVVVPIVKALRAVLPGRYLHVLGLSSPKYAQTWSRCGVNSFDGSSHFKQAFTAGAFYTVTDDGELVKHLATRRDHPELTAPACVCRSCTVLRADGVDTRSYGSNEHNMGRAAHNLNMLMAAHHIVMRRRIMLVGCSGPKADYPRPAKDLYQSPLFRAARQYAEQHGDDWRILSAKYGVVHPDDVIAPYDQVLTPQEQSLWNAQVRDELRPFHGETLVLLAGASYGRWAEHTDFQVEYPLAGLGIGQRLAWFRQQPARQGDLLGQAIA